MKKILILLFLLILIGAGAGYYFYFYAAPQTNDNQTASTTGNGAPIFPEGGTVTAPADTGDTTSASSTPIIALGPQISQTAKVVQITNTPSAGAAFATVGTTTALRYASRSDGHIYQVMSGVTTKISNTTIPKLEDVLAAEKGIAFIVRYLRDDITNVVTYAGELKPSGTTSPDHTQYTLVGNFLPDNISGLAVSPDGNSLFYVQPMETGSRGIINTIKTGKTRVLFESALREFQASWATAGTIALTTKPSGTTGGFLYFMNTSNGSVKRILGNIKGLTALPNPTGEYVLFAEGGASEHLKLYTVKTGATEDLAMGGLPEKCVWGQKNKTTAYCAVPNAIPAGLYPDDWYQGHVTFTDKIMSINAPSGSVAQVITSTALTADIDAINLVMNAKDDTLIFTNKKDSTIWSLNLSTGTTTPR